MLNFSLLLAENTMTVGKVRAVKLDVLTYDKYYAFFQGSAAIDTTAEKFKGNIQEICSVRKKISNIKL